jgi:hypothetical protein
LKQGSHKIGYSYIATSGTEMITKTFEGFIEKTNVCIDELVQLMENCQDKDPLLKKITEEQILGYKVYVELLEYTLNFFRDKLSNLEVTGGE